MFCNKCAVKVNEEDVYCFNCGNKLKETPVVVSKRVEVVSKKQVHKCFEVFAVLALVIGILSSILLFSNFLNFSLLIVGLEILEDFEFALSIHGVVFGVLGCKSAYHKGKAITGLVLSSVVTVISLLSFIIYLI